MGKAAEKASRWRVGNRTPRAWVFTVAGLLVSACGVGSTPASMDSTGLPPGQAGGPVQQGPFPANHPPLPKMVSAGGSVMKSPRLTVVTFSATANVQVLETFGTKLSGSAFWAMLQSEYGVGPLSTTAPVEHVTLPSPPASNPSGPILGEDLEALLQSQLSSANSTWPLPNDSSNSLYVFFLPNSTQVSLPQQAGPGVVCQDGIVGYHFETTANVQSTTRKISYAVIGDCLDHSPLGSITPIASHEIAESATDPFPDSAPAFSNFDMNHLAWAMFGSEIGDYCANVSNSAYLASDIGYYLQRLWSNSAVDAGHDPCWPAFNGEIYFNTAPVLTDTLLISPSTSDTTPGVVVPPSGKTIELDLFSEAALSPWAVDVQVLLDPSQAQPTVILSKSEGENGDRIALTFPYQSSDSGQTIQATIHSTLGNQEVYWPFLLVFQ